MDSFNSSMFAQSAISQEPPRTMEYAGIFKRFIARIIDNIIATVIFYIISFGIGFVVGIIAPDQIVMLQQLSTISDKSTIPPDQMAPAMDLMMILAGVVILIFWLYYAGFESSGMQATPGKRMLGMKVTDTDGDPIGFGVATGRYLGKYISGLLFGIGFLIAFFTQKKQALHDLIAGTIVINR